jgi:hypothetical protein
MEQVWHLASAATRGQGPRPPSRARQGKWVSIVVAATVDRLVHQRSRSSAALPGQKTTQKANQAIAESMHALRNPDGTPMGVEVSTVRARHVPGAGNLRQFAVGDDINVEMSSSFELYRRSINDVEDRYVR